jgi:carbonic anhydrase/acetyltransferase-like protein (isoleucine patch superfamily)
LCRFENNVPAIGDETFVSKSSEVIGNVIIGRQCYIGSGAIIRGDYGSILIGDKTSVEENCVLHARPKGTCNVGSMVTVGHGSILHNCTVSDYAVIGMGAIVSDYAVVGEWAVIGEGCVVKNKQVIESRKVAVGMPARIIGDVSEDYRREWTGYKELYARLALKYRKTLRVAHVRKGIGQRR